MKRIMDISISFWWKNEKNEDPPESIKNELKNHALDRITELQKEGYTSGELLYATEDDSYNGWFMIHES